MTAPRRRRRRRISAGWRLRRVRRWAAVLVILLLALAIYADRRGWLLVPFVNDHETYHGRTVLVTRVIDGDTIEVAMPDLLNGTPGTRVRLWGLDAPEMPGPDRPRAQPGARAATRHLRDLVEGKLVVLRLETHDTRDAYDRLLAHVQTPAGAMVNAMLIRAGHARAEDRWPHSMLREYERQERLAREAGAGIWAPGGR